MSDSLPPPPIHLVVNSPTPSSLLSPLSLLLEPSPPLSRLLLPQLHEKLQATQAKPNSYKELLSLSEEIVDGWAITDQAEFIEAHPRIGETKNLSAMSGKEQGGAVQTPGEVLKRLGMLNALYEDSFPGLRYITFVNGRSRAEIIPELEAIIGIDLPPPSPSMGEPRLGQMRSGAAPQVRVTGSEAWRKELKRGLRAMWDIAEARLNGLGVQ